MYVPGHFAESDLAALDWLFERDAFVTLVTGDPQGEVMANHLPVLYSRQGEKVRLRGHWARPNPQWRGLDGRNAMAIVHGPHTYVSPSWYVEPETNVPTWNYAVAHVTGPVRVFEDVDALAALVSELALKYEDSLGSCWRFDRRAGHNPNQLRGIVGFELTAERIELKFKLNQNHPPENVLGVVKALEARGGEDGVEIAKLMRQRLELRGSEKD